MISKFVLIISLTAFVNADFQYITLYQEQNQGGLFLTIEEHVPDISQHEYADLIGNASSYCAVGWWVGYTNPNYNLEGGVGIFLDQASGTPRCENRIFINFKSLRYLGTSNSDLPSISLYSKASYHGLEVLVDGNGTLSSALTYKPLSFVTTGHSNWTFYNQTDHSGQSWCYESTNKVQLVANINSAWPDIQSVDAGCKTLQPPTFV